MYSYRVPESLYDEIGRMVKLRINEYERELLTGEKKSNPADNSLKLGSVAKVDGKEATIVSQIGTPTKFSGDDFKHIVYKDDVVESKKTEPQVVEHKIEYEILESFPFGIEKIEDYGKNKSLYFCEPDYYTRVVNEKAKHISYESAVNYLKSK